MRGETTIRHIKENAEQAITKRGRNLEYVQRRNECLIDRYYYYTTAKQKRYETTMAILAQEFFISVRTITDMLPHYKEQLEVLKNKRPKTGYFADRWPHMKW